jgi:hypothetical protein
MRKMFRAMYYTSNPIKRKKKKNKKKGEKKMN